MIVAFVYCKSQLQWYSYVIYYYLIFISNVQNEHLISVNGLFVNYFNSYFNNDNFDKIEYGQRNIKVKLLNYY